jgi:predicted RNA methylase
LKFYATFAAGLQDVLAGVVAERLGDAKIPGCMEGALVFETSCPYDQLNFYCFNNIFALIASAPGPVRSLIEAVAGGTIRPDRAVIGRNNPKISSFRLVVSVNNGLCAPNTRALGLVERKISQISGLRVDKVRPDTEFWFLERSEGRQTGGKTHSFFLKRLTKHASWDKKLHKGELPPPLAWTLCWLARPVYGQALADPFCGYGSIPYALTRYFPPCRIYAGDTDGACLAWTRKKLGERKDLTLLREDAFNLAGRCPQGLDAVVTDPPWGSFRAGKAAPAFNAPEFYSRLAAAFKAVLKSGGRAVVLTACRSEMREGAVNAGLSPEQEIPILLSGRKAAVFVLRS